MPREWVRRFVGVVQPGPPGPPGQPGQDDQGPDDSADKGPKKTRDSSTLFKMFESAATTFASLTVLG